MQFSRNFYYNFFKPVNPKTRTSKPEPDNCILGKPEPEINPILENICYPKKPEPELPPVGWTRTRRIPDPIMHYKLQT